MSHSGKCFCGGVTVEVDGPPAVQGFCHCNDCRNWSGMPVTSYALWPTASVRVTEGADLVGNYSKDGTAHRRHCTRCGASLMVEIPSAGMTDVFPLRLDGLTFVPQAHVFYAARVIDMPDGLPKFADLPERSGGSGEMIAD